MMAPIRSGILAICLVLAHGYSVGIFDAGSTGTRLNIYTFDGESIGRVLSYKQQGGLHEMPLSGVRAAIDYLVGESQADELVPLWFYGTAGMRSLFTARQEAILAEVRDVLTGYNLQEAAVLDATMEGAYMLKAFEYLSPASELFMIVDMGGLSVQLIKKDEDGLQIESYELGITQGQCDDGRASDYPAAEQPCTSCGQCPAGVREGRLMDVFDNSENTRLLDAYCRQSQCILDKFLAGSVKRAKTDCCKHTIFLCSYMHDLFAGYGKVLTLDSLENIFRTRCGAALSRECRQIYYAVMFLERLGVCEDERLYPLRRIDGFDVTWALGRAIEAARCGRAR